MFTCGECKNFKRDSNSEWKFGRGHSGLCIPTGRARMTGDSRLPNCGFLYDAAEDETAISSDDGLICPYCGYVTPIDPADAAAVAEISYSSWMCPECGKAYKLEVELSVTYTTTRTEG